MSLCQLCGAPSPFTRNQLKTRVVIGVWTQQYRLNNAIFPNRNRKLIKRQFIEAAPWLPRTNINPLYRYFAQPRE